jgi:hypothetical protein
VIGFKLESHDHIKHIQVMCLKKIFHNLNGFSPNLSARFLFPDPIQYSCRPL